MKKKRFELQVDDRRAIVAAKRLAYSREGINAVDFGYVYKRGERTNAVGLRFHVSQKRPLREIPPENILPKDIHGIHTDVLVAAYALHGSFAVSTADTLQPGISIGNLMRTTTGTLGLIVRDVASGSKAVLSNWHVLCGSPDCTAGEQITHPGPLDSDQTSPSKVAELMRWTNLAHGYDAATAKIVTDIGASNDIPELHLNVAEIAEPHLGMHIEKVGIASGTSHGVVDGVEGAYRMDYSPYGEAVYWMDGMHIVPDPTDPDHDLSLDGDSGAIWVDPQTESAVGLHFGGDNPGSPLAEYAVAHRLSAVLQLLQIQL
jgi:hypothetical protein